MAYESGCVRVCLSEMHAELEMLLANCCLLDGWGGGREERELRIYFLLNDLLKHPQKPTHQRTARQRGRRESPTRFSSTPLPFFHPCNAYNGPEISAGCVN